ncbi:hypothetical protein V5O48_004293 [Marasmius crinis-equi]|uniref:Uncharacterized protein n=1 Tax=Marasmius crinis-equi TaxID=585013 RepID=A0ABR3FQK7_9AGAR
MAPPVPISSLIVEDWFHGLYTTGVFLTLWVIFKNTSYDTRRKANLVALVVGMYGLSTIHCGLQWFYYSSAIDENELSGGPGLLNSLSHIAPWIEAVGDTAFCLNVLIADILFIWRAWVIWQKRWIIIILPTIMTICGVALAARFVVALLTLESSGDAFTAIKRQHDFVAFSTAYFVLSIATSVITTFFLAMRIILVQRAAFKATGRRDNPFSAAIEIPVESAVLYSISLLIFVVLNVTKNPNAFYAQNIHAQVTGLTPLLIVLRVAAGHSRPDTAWSVSIDPSIHTRTQAETNAGDLSKIVFRPGDTTTGGSTRNAEGSRCEYKEEGSTVRATHASDIESDVKKEMV